MIQLIVAMFVAASEPEEVPSLVIPITCNGDVCVVPREIVKAMMDAHNEHVDEIRKLEDQIRHPKCAKTEVTEPSRGIK